MEGPFPPDAAFMRRVAEVEAELRALEMLTLRALAEHDPSGEAGAAWPAGSILHVLGSELQQKTGALLVHMAGTFTLIANVTYLEQ